MVTQTRRTSLCLAAVGLLAVGAVAQTTDIPDPVLKFYVERAGAVFKSHDPVETGVAYSFTATSYYKKISSDGRVEKVDSAVAECFFSFGNLDSQKVRLETSDKFSSLDFSVPDVFQGGYRYNFFPNDTGGVEIAVGFDTKTADDPAPVGLALIDRAKHSLRRLILFYPSKEGYRRFSRTLWLTDFEGRVFPDSICEVGAKYGFFSTHHYRLETRIDNYRIIRR